MYKLRRKLLSQNFLYNRKLIYRLLGYSSIGKNDLIIEIGPGKGIITEQLTMYSRHVIGVELDNNLYNYLLTKFATCPNLTLYNQDILSFSLPALPYKVFANIPFAIEGKIIRKLLDDPHPPEDCYLVIMKDLAIRLEAKHKENYFSICHKPWFDFSIDHYFQRTDFIPEPKVDAVLFRFVKKQYPLLQAQDKQKYQKFIKRGFDHGQAVYQNLRRFYDVNKLTAAFQKLSLSRKAKPGYLSLQQWVRIYKTLQTFL